MSTLYVVGIPMRDLSQPTEIKQWGEGALTSGESGAHATGTNKVALRSSHSNSSAIVS